MHINVRSPPQESHLAEVAEVGGSRRIALTKVYQREIKKASPDKTALQKMCSDGKDMS